MLNVQVLTIFWFHLTINGLVVNSLCPKSEQSDSFGLVWERLAEDPRTCWLSPEQGRVDIQLMLEGNFREAALAGLLDRCFPETFEGRTYFKQLPHASYSQLVSDLANQGFRLPSADEWEYACAAGTRTLFHWGDQVPCDFDRFYRLREAGTNTENQMASACPSPAIRMSWNCCSRPGLWRSSCGAVTHATAFLKTERI